MKIAIPIDETKTSVCPSFGRALYFMIADTDTGERTIISNSAAESSGGAGIKAAQAIIDQNVKVLLTPRCGQNAAEVFVSAGIPIYQTATDSVDDAIKAFQKGELTALQNIHPGFHGHGGK